MSSKKKSSRKSNAPKIKDLDAQQRKLAIIKQKKCDAVALHLVKRMIDCSVEEDVFVQCLKHLNQCHFQDIVEERAIGKMCGYPICCNSIPEMPAKKYHISSKSNKVYDITERKNYCSNFCYKAGMHIKEQMLISPLWFRDKEDVPEFNLLPKTESGLPGIEVDHGLIKLDPEDQETFKSISDFTSDSISDLSEELTDKITVECEKTSTHCETNSNDSIMNNYYSIIAPSLANILQENAKYFNNRTNLEIKFDETVMNTKPEKNIEIYEESFNTKSEINTECGRKVKGILSKGKKLKDKKKRVSFDQDIKDNENNQKTLGYKNINVVGCVQEKSYIYKTETLQKYKKPNEISNKPTSDHANDSNEILQNSVNAVRNIETNSATCNLQQRKINEKLENVTGIDLNDKYIPKNVENSLNKIEISEPKFQIDLGINLKSSENPQENININCSNEREIAKSEPNKIFKKPVIESQNKNLENANTSENCNEKSKRVNRLKSSSLYKKTKQQNKTLIESETKENILSENVKINLRNRLKEWLTMETAVFLFGEEYVKKIMSDKSYKEYLNKQKNIYLDEKNQQKYNKICKLLNVQELEDMKYDESLTGKKRLPLPRYERLKEEAETMDLKVRAFYAGCYELIEEDNESETEVDEESDEESYIIKGSPAVLPLIDSKDLVATRRKIFLTSLHRSVIGLCELLGQNGNSILSNIKLLINTFQFTANNIVFKTKEWQLVAILLLKLLSLRDKDLYSDLQNQKINEFISILCQQFNTKEENIDNFLVNKEEIRSILEECIQVCLN